jgi:hypothetical protein
VLAGVTHEVTGAELDLIRHVMRAHEVGHSDTKRWVDENYGLSLDMSGVFRRT